MGERLRTKSRRRCKWTWYFPRLRSALKLFLFLLFHSFQIPTLSSLRAKLLEIQARDHEFFRKRKRYFRYLLSPLLKFIPSRAKMSAALLQEESKSTKIDSFASLRRSGSSSQSSGSWTSIKTIKKPDPAPVTRSLKRTLVDGGQVRKNELCFCWFLSDWVCLEAQEAENRSITKVPPRTYNLPAQISYPNPKTPWWPDSHEGSTSILFGGDVWSMIAPFTSTLLILRDLSSRKIQNG